MNEPAATCATHHQPAKGPCTRCGTFLCAECGPLSLCPACLVHALPNEARIRRAQEVARASWMAFVITLGVNAVFAQTGSAMIKGLGMLLMLVLGLGAGVVALFLRRGTNAPKVIGPAIIGILLNGLALGLMVVGAVVAFLAAVKRR